MTKLTDKKIIVIYHNDADGFGAAWAARKRFGNRAKYIPIDYGESLPKLDCFKNKKVYFLDFCAPLSQMKEIRRSVKSITLIDHHLYREPTLKIVSDYLYDKKHSGAVLTWQYFHSQKPTPKILLYIEDMDIWRFKLPFTKEIIAAMETVPYDFKIWSKIAADLSSAKKRKRYVKAGKIILSYQKAMVEKLVAGADKVLFNGYKTLAVNSPIFKSEIGHALAKKLPPIGIVWSQHKDFRTFSLRASRPLDLAKIARRYQGGGQKSAAGFEIKINKSLPWKSIN